MNVYYDTVLDPRTGIRWLGQGLDALGAYGFDRYCLMAYHLQIAEELQIPVSEAIALAGRASAQLYDRVGPRLAVKLQTVDWKSGSPVDVEDLGALAQAAARAGAGLVLAPADSARADELAETIRTYRERAAR